MMEEMTGQTGYVNLLSRAADLLDELEMEMAASRAAIDAAEERLVDAPARARKSGIFPAYRRAS
jgi:hypothetical protein